MAMNDPIDDEAARLYAALGGYSVSPLILEHGFPEFSVDSKNRVVARLAAASNVPQPGKVLGRLPFILTPANAQDMAAVFINNLHGVEADARTSSLYGLQRLAHRRLEEFAETLLSDPNDDVLVAAISVLVPKAKQDQRLRQRFEELYRANRGNPAFYTSNALLEAHGFVAGSGGSSQPKR